MAKLITNFILFQVGWFACIMGGTMVAVPVALLVIAGHLWYVNDLKKEWLFLLTCAIYGTLVDTTLMQLGVFEFPKQAEDSLLIPLWLTGVWVVFGTTFNHSMSWTKNYLWAGGILGAIAGPLCYIAGTKLSNGAITFQDISWIQFSTDQLSAYPILEQVQSRAVIISAIEWAITIPLLAYLAGKITNNETTSQAAHTDSQPEVATNQA